MTRKKLLFVCLGNICRSPTAEAVAQKKIQQRGLDWFCDSAGTAAYHQGEPADPRTIRHGKGRNYEVTSISRPVVAADFKNFDWILAMDASNLQNLKRMCPDPQHLEKLSLITDYCEKFQVLGVLDPYTGPASDFELVIDILEDAVEGFLNHVGAGER